MRPQSQEIVLMFVGGQNMMLRPMDLWDEQRGATLRWRHQLSMFLLGAPWRSGKNHLISIVSLKELYSIK